MFISLLLGVGEAGLNYHKLVQTQNGLEAFAHDL